MIAVVDEEIDRFVEFFPTVGRVVREAAHGHPLAGHIDQLLEVFGSGYLTYLYTGSTPLPAAMSIRWLACLTNGRFNDVMQDFLRSLPLHQPYPFAAPSGLFGDLDETGFREVVTGLAKDGFWVFKERLPAEQCERLRAFASNVDCLAETVSNSMLIRYDAQQPQSVTYHVPQAELVKNADVQNLLGDTSLLALVQDYFGSKPVIPLMCMWWSTALSKEPDSGAAQLYHFDMDQICFLKFFIYLTDVTPENGPHCLVRGSHRNKPMALRRDGRIPDQEIEQHYPKEDLVQLTGSQGTMFLVDTRAFHKGKNLEAGDRLMFQTLYASDLFGAPYELVPAVEPLEPSFAGALREYPRSYAKFLAPRISRRDELPPDDGGGIQRI